MHKLYVSINYNILKDTDESSHFLFRIGQTVKPVVSWIDIHTSQKLKYFALQMLSFWIQDSPIKRIISGNHIEYVNLYAF